MIFVKKFLDKMSVAESKNIRDVVLPMQDARGLRDDLTKLLGDYYQLKSDENDSEKVIEVEIKGGSFK